VVAEWQRERIFPSPLGGHWQVAPAATRLWALTLDHSRASASAVGLRFRMRPDRYGHGAGVQCVRSPGTKARVRTVRDESAHSVFLTPSAQPPVIPIRNRPMSPLSNTDRRSFAFALLHPGSASHLPPRLQRTRRLPADRTFCATHQPFDGALLTSLAARLRELATIKSDVLATALAAAASVPEWKRKDVDAAERLLHYYRELLLHAPDGCDGCAVAAVARGNGALFVLVAGGLVWRRDRPAVANWLPIWLERLDPVERRCLMNEAASDAHRVRRLLRGLKARTTDVEREAHDDSSRRTQPSAVSTGTGSDPDPFADPRDAAGRRRGEYGHPRAADTVPVLQNPSAACPGSGPGGGHRLRGRHPAGLSESTPASLWTLNPESTRPGRFPREGEPF